MTTRRDFVSGSMLATACLLLSGENARASESTQPLTWDAFLEETKARARKLLQEEKTPTDAYLHFLASRMLLRDDIRPNKLQAVPWAKPTIEFGAEKSGPPFTIIEFKMAPGAYLPPHNHPNGSVCTILLEGEAMADNFEFDGDRPEPGEAGEFRLRHTKRERLTPRQVSVLTPDRNNLHAFRAGAHGARGIDLTTMHGPAAKFGFVRLRGSERPGDLVAGEWFDPRGASAIQTTSS